MADEIRIGLADPIQLSLVEVPPIQVVTTLNGPVGPNGLSAYQLYLTTTEDDPPLTLEEWLSYLRWGYIGDGPRDSSLDEGTLGSISLTEDYLYICTKTGNIGEATWKKIPLLES